MTKHPYSTTHFQCGCHIVERKVGELAYNRSVYCGMPTQRCLYATIAYRRLREWRKEGGPNALQNC